MYEKMLNGRQVLHFRYAPPITALDDVSKDERPKAPFKAAEPYQCSVFYYWWAFLRENDAYGICCQLEGIGPLADLYSFFGDVRGDDFMRWWRLGGHSRGSAHRQRAGRQLFCEPPHGQIKPMTPPLDESDIRQDRIILSVPVTNDLGRLAAEFEQLLKPLVAERLQALGQPKSSPLFDVVSKPVLSTLHTLLTAWQAKRANPTMGHYQLAQMLGITSNIEGKRGDTDHEKRVYATLGRHLRKAAVLIKNTEYGRFPDFTDYEKTGAKPELPKGLRNLIRHRDKANGSVGYSD